MNDRMMAWARGLLIVPLLGAFPLFGAAGCGGEPETETVIPEEEDLPHNKAKESMDYYRNKIKTEGRR